MDREDYWLWLSNVKGMWNGKMKKLMEVFGEPREIYNSSEKTLVACGKLSVDDIKEISASKEKFDIDKMKEYLRKNGIQFITAESKCYPERLKQIKDSPCCLYVKGELPRGEKAAAIVGARACTSYGRQIAKNLGCILGRAGADVISGMARGIDTYGHRGAMEAEAKTFAVLGCGVDICYPSENIEIYEYTSKKGGIISEFPPGTRPDGFRFPQRNRIISALSDLVIVVEARVKSGSLITAEAALEQGRDVLAVPGRIGDGLSAGCNRLIRDGAGILTDEEDVLSYLGIDDITTVKKSEILNKVLEKDFEVVYSNTDLSPVSLEELVRSTGMEAGRVYEIILELEIAGFIYEPVKNYYARTV